jgi:RNA polymerase sigma-70 factor (ECF subfamily)
MGYSAEETARMIGSTPGAIRVTQHRAMVKLRALLAGRLADD